MSLNRVYVSNNGFGTESKKDPGVLRRCPNFEIRRQGGTDLRRCVKCRQKKKDTSVVVPRSGSIPEE